MIQLRLLNPFWSRNAGRISVTVVGWVSSFAITVIGLLWWPSPVAYFEYLRIFFLPLLSIMIVAFTWLIMPSSDLEESNFTSEQVYGIALWDPMAMVIINLEVGLCQYFTYFGKSTTHKVVVPVVSTVLGITLLLKLGTMIFAFCRTRHRSSIESGRSSRSTICLFLYYLAGIVTIATIFANVYYGAIIQKEPAQTDYLGHDLSIPLPAGEMDVSGHQKALQALCDFMVQKESVLIVEAILPRGINSSARASLRQTLRDIVKEAEEISRSRIDSRGIVFHIEQSTENTGVRSVLLHLQENRQPFTSCSESFFDAFFMSAQTLVSIGLTETTPVTHAMKLVVLMEELIGVLFFVVFLGAVVAALTDRPEESTL